MLKLLQPSWLFLMTGISIPVIIHLWNQKPGKVLKVGTISMVTESVKEYRKSLTLSDILLLILRSLLISALALALAQPRWQSADDPSKRKGWIVINDKDISETYIQFKSIIDSLLKAGMEFHYFKKDFPKQEFALALKNESAYTEERQRSYWSLAVELDETTNHSIPIYLFTNNYLSHFAGTRPVISDKIKWFSYSRADVLPQQVRQSKSDTTAIKISIYSKNNEQDANYVKAALEAVRQFNKSNLQVAVTNQATAIPSGIDWLFWLSDEPSTDQASKSKNILRYEKGTVEKRFSWIFPVEQLSFAPVESYLRLKTDSTNNDSMSNVWQDGFGNAILAVEKKRDLSFYHFYSRFNPSWSDMVWNNSFPGIIYTLIKKKESGFSGADTTDKRLIDKTQLLPSFVSNTEIQKSQDLFKYTDLTNYSWILVCILFFLERLISIEYYKRKADA